MSFTFTSLRSPYQDVIDQQMEKEFHVKLPTGELENMIDLMRKRRYVLCLVSNTSLEDAAESHHEKPDAVAVCYDYNSFNGMFWTSRGHFRYVMELPSDDIFID